MGQTLELTFPFVEDLPKREKTRFQKFMEAWAVAKAIAEEKGGLIPATFAAKICDVSKQRIHELMEKGTLERVELNEHVFITEHSLMTWLKAPENKGGRPRLEKMSKKDIWNISHEWAKETVSPQKSRRK